MKLLCALGDVRKIAKVVEAGDLATFETGNVHPFYSTFALGRDAEWACRQFVLEMRMEILGENFGMDLSYLKYQMSFLNYSCIGNYVYRNHTKTLNPFESV